MAAGTGGRAVSPSPWTSAPSRSIRSCVMRDGQVAGSGNVVVGQVGVRDLPVGELDLLQQRRAEAHDHRALVLQLGARPVDHAARRRPRRAGARRVTRAGLLVDRDVRARPRPGASAMEATPWPVSGSRPPSLTISARAALAAAARRSATATVERPAHHVGGAARRRAGVERRAVRVGVGHLDLARLAAQQLRADQPQRPADPLAHLARGRADDVADRRALDAICARLGVCMPFSSTHRPLPRGSSS